MKKILFFSVLTLLVSFANSQIITISYNGTPLATGDTVSVKASGDEAKFYPVFSNNEFFNRICLIHVEKQNESATNVSSVCTGGVCMTGSYSAPLLLRGNHEYDSTYIDFYVPTDAEMALFKVEIYDTADNDINNHVYVRVYNKNATLGINPSVSDNCSLSSYPNPTSGKTTITYSIKGETGMLVMYDMTGKRVVEKELHGSNGTLALDLEGLSKGMYLYGVIDGVTTPRMKKIIVR